MWGWTKLHEDMRWERSHWNSGQTTLSLGLEGQGALPAPSGSLLWMLQRCPGTPGWCISATVSLGVWARVGSAA